MIKQNKDTKRLILANAYADNKKSLQKHAYFKVNNHEKSEDLVHETFLKTWKYLVKGGKIEIMKAFLYHILNDLIVDDYRKRKTTSLDTLLEKGFSPGFDNTERIFNIFDGQEAFTFIQYLPKKYQKIMRMRYEQDLSIKEISLITGQSRNTVAVQAHRGLEKLKVLYMKNNKK